VARVRRVAVAADPHHVKRAAAVAGAADLCGAGPLDLRRLLIRMRRGRGRLHLAASAFRAGAVDTRAGFGSVPTLRQARGMHDAVPRRIATAHAMLRAVVANRTT